MDPNARSYLSRHRQSLRPSAGSSLISSTTLASRYGIGSVSGSGKRTSSAGLTSLGSSSSPIRSRSNSTSRFKAAAAVAVAAATGNKQFAHRTSIVPGSFNVRNIGGNSGSNSLSSGSASTSTSSGANSSASTASGSTNSSYGNTSGGSTGSVVDAGTISSTVVSFMKKFVNKATIPNNTSNSIDLSVEQYQKQLKQNAAAAAAAGTGTGASGPVSTTTGSVAQSPTKYLFSAITGTTSSSDTGYSSIGNSPITTPSTIATNNTIGGLNASIISTNASISNVTPVQPLINCSSASGLAVNQFDNYASSRPSSSTSVLNTSNTTIGQAAGSLARGGPLLSKIRTKVASTFQQPQTPQSSCVSSSIQNSSVATSNIDDSNRNLFMSSAVVSGNAITDCGNAAGNLISGSTNIQQRAPMLSMISSQSSSLTNEQLTAHLTDEERQILAKVWQKEEKFKEITLKNFSKNIATTEIVLPEEDTSTTYGNVSGPLLTGTMPASGDVSHLSTNLLDPVAAAVHRRRSSAIMSADATGFCRICRKVIMKNETSHRCSNCQELVCDDCSSYSSREESKYWMCSFCRRRGSHLVLSTASNPINATSSFVNSTGMDGTGTTMVSSYQRKSFSCISTNANDSLPDENSNSSSTQQFLSTSPNSKRKLSFQDLKRPKSALDQYNTGQNRQNSLDLNRQTTTNETDTATTPTFMKCKPNINNHNKTNDNNNNNNIINNNDNEMRAGSVLEPIFNKTQPTSPLAISKTAISIGSELTPSTGTVTAIAEPKELTPTTPRRARIYSLSDDEELWGNNEEDDGDDENFEDVLMDDCVGEYGEIEYRDNGIDGVSKTTPTGSSGTSGKLQQSHYGTLQSIPVETLKLQRINNAKRKKKRSSHGSVQYNSDDELMVNSYGNKKQEMENTNAPPITITSLDGPVLNESCLNKNIVHNTNFAQNGLTNTTNLPSTVSPGGVSYQQCQNKQPKILPTIIPKIITVTSGGSAGSKLPSSVITAAHWWRLTNKARSLSRANGGPEAFYGTRKQLSSESSDFSDGIRYSPPQDSLTPSSEYSRSPRESADSEMLGLTPAYASTLAAQCRGIPSVLIGNGDDVITINHTGSTYLSTKDCYLRRGSTGRALPKIPVAAVATGSSMLDLPHSRKSSQHSLDIPMEQPRRASAPESGDPIRIVIDECGDLSASHIALSTNDYPNKNSLTNINEMDSKGDSALISTSSPSIIHSQQAASIINVKVPTIHPPTTTLQQRMRYQLSRATSITTHYERIVLQRDKTDQSTRTRGFSLAITGGKLSELDGMLYAYVMWIKPGGQADRHSMKSGDKILEWNGKSFVNCSHEQVCHIMDNSGDTVELVVESMVRNDRSTKRRHSLNTQQQQSQAAKESGEQATTTSTTAPVNTTPGRPSSAAAAISTTTSGSFSSSTPSSSSVNSTQQPPGSSLRRRLPQIPSATNINLENQTASAAAAAAAAAILNDAQIYLQITFDANIRQLSIIIIRAKGLDRHPIYVHNPGLEAYVQLRLLPEMGFKICQTEFNRTFDWNETLIYHQFPLNNIEQITLDLSIWCTWPTSGFIPGGSKSPRIMISGGSTTPQPANLDHQLASTRIPLRNALLMQASEWWPLIPCNTDLSFLPSPPSIQPPVTANSASSLATALFIPKISSMEQIDPNGLGISLSDQMMLMMTSRSTPNSRRNSNRSDYGGDCTTPPIHYSPTPTRINGSSANRIKTSPTPPPTSASWFQRYRSSPSRASAASTLSSSTGGRHSLDESLSISNSARSGSAASGSIPRFTSLRLASNRHSIGNLYQVPVNSKTSISQVAGQYLSTGVSQVQQQHQQQLSSRRKSSSALLLNKAESKMCNKLSVPNEGYMQMDSDSYQYLLEPNTLNTDSNQKLFFSGNPETEYQSDQDSELNTSDDDADFENLLKDSNYTLDSLENKERTKQNSQSVTVPPVPQLQIKEESFDNKLGDNSNLNAKHLTIPGLNPQDSNLLSIGGSRYSVNTMSTSPRTPTCEDFEDGDENSQSGGLTIPVSRERRPSFLRRLVPSAAETVMNMMIGGPGSNAQPSDEILHPNNSSTMIAAHPKRTVVVVGEIKLGFIMTKGFLEIEVIAARGLPDSTFGPYPPDTYVKTYLVDKGRQIYKRKTNVVPSEKEPQYRQTLKYDASIIYGRTLLVSVWEKQRRRRTFDANSPIGSVEINVNQLQLHKLTIRWFKLRSFAQNNNPQPGGDLTTSLDTKASGEVTQNEN